MITVHFVNEFREFLFLPQMLSVNSTADIDYNIILVDSIFLT